jgi:hypothetical protein
MCASIPSTTGPKAPKLGALALSWSVDANHVLTRVTGWLGAYREESYVVMNLDSLNAMQQWYR